ncbi:MAG: DUF11 domain-containing protein [Bacteroidetes bacterium]|nr:MAG: DUF11 domain-containing protein [Bacteroidota bacterium]
MHIRSLISTFIAALPFLFLGAAETAFAAGTPAGTVIQTRSRAVYTTAGGTATDTVFSSFVSFTVRQVGAFNVTPSDDGRSSSSDSASVEYPVTVTNSGNGTDAGTLTAVSSHGWTVTVYRDANGDGVLQPAEITAGPVSQTVSLPADAAERFIVRLFVPRTEAMDGLKDTVSLQARSLFDTSRHTTGRYITTVRSADLRSVLSGLTVDDPLPSPGSTIIYTFTLSNAGSLPAQGVTVHDILPAGLTLVSGSSSQGSFTSSSAPLVWSLGTVASAGTATITLTATVNASVASGTVIPNAMTVLYTVGSNSYVRTSNSVQVTVGGSPSYGVSLVRENSSAVKEPGDTAVYRYRLTNTGNYSDVIELTPLSSRSLGWGLYRDSNGNGLFDPADAAMTNTNGAGAADTDSIAAGDSVRFFARAIVPRSYADLLTDTLTVTAVSSGDGTKSAVQNALTTIVEPVVVLSKSVLPAGSQPAGAVVTYTIAYSNTGSVSVAAFTVTDVTPASTEYIPNSVKVNGTGVNDNTGALSVTEDPDANTVIAVSVGALSAGGSGSVEFKVRIK